MALAGALAGCRRATNHVPAVAADAQAARLAQDAAVRRATPAPPHDKDTKYKPPIELSWSADGSRLVVDDRLVLDVRDGRYIAVPCPSAGGDAPGGCEGRSLSLSPDGAALLFIDDGRL